MSRRRGEDGAGRRDNGLTPSDEAGHLGPDAGERPARILILGGGFAGVYAALRLRKALPASRYELVLVNRDNFFLFTPMLHEVAASDLDVTHIVNPIRKLLPAGAIFVGSVEGIDLDRRRVTVAHASGRHRHELEYDHLVLALGSVTNYFGIPGLAEAALPMKSLGDALGLRNRLIELLDEADFECAADQRHSLLTVLVAGGGFAGVETVAAVNDFLREAVEFYPHLSEEMLRIVLVEAGPVLLPELDRSLGEYAARKLAARGIEVRLRTPVRGISDRGIELGDGTVVPAETVVWTAGTSPHPLVASLPCRTERGRVCVDEYLRVEDRPGVWALGDCARVPDGRGGFHPPTAQHALRQGKVLADNIAASILGRPLRPFRFRALGQLAAIGRRTGVANVFGLNFSGFVAWWLWRSIYLSKLPRFERKVRVALDWSLDLVFSKDLVQVQPATAGPGGPAEARGAGVPDRSRRGRRSRARGGRRPATGPRGPGHRPGRIHFRGGRAAGLRHRHPSSDVPASRRAPACPEPPAALPHSSSRRAGPTGAGDTGPTTSAAEATEARAGLARERTR